MRNAKWALSALLLILLLWQAYQIAQLNANQQLWGHRPLWLLLTGWAMLALLSYRPAFQDMLLGASLSGLLMAGAFAGKTALPFLAFTGIAPILWLEYRVRHTDTAHPKRLLAWYAYLAFLLWNILSTYWVSNASLAAGLFAVLVNSAIMVLPVLVFRLVMKYMPKLSFIAFATTWAGMEYLHHRWDLSWPWLTIGNSMAAFPKWAQWYEYTGVLGGSVWIVFANILLFEWMIVDKGSRKSKRVVPLIIVLLVPLAISHWKYYRIDLNGPTAEFVAVQPNVEPHYGELNRTEADLAQNAVSTAAAAISEETACVVFPETTFSGLQIPEWNQSAAITQLREMQQRYPQLHILAGISAYHVLAPGEAHNAFTRTQTGRTGEAFFWEGYNAAAHLAPGNGDIGLYSKSKLVAGAEFMPFARYLGFLKPVVANFGGSTAGLVTQAERSVFDMGKVKAAPVICYESVFGEFLGGYIRKGANVICIMTNDGWWDQTAGHRQHLRYASLRAIETRRSIVRAANTGVSTIINARGDILQATAYNEKTAVKATVELRDGATFYVRWGDFIGRLCLFAGLLLTLNGLVKHWTNTAKSR